MIFILDPNSLLFPDPQLAEPDGFLAIGGDASPERLRAAYSSGIFPWSAFDSECELFWWAPRPRFVLRPAEVHISHSMRQLRRSGRYRVTFNTAFARVVDGCRTAQNRHQHEGAWLSEPLMASFCQLHDEGLAAEGDGIIDCQLPTDHLHSMGAREMDYEEYRQYLPPHEHYIDRFVD